MTNEELIAKIKAEIEGRIEIYIGNAQSCIDTTLVDGLHEALDILSTLESEKPINLDDAMKELDEKIALVKERGTWDGVDVDKYMDAVRGREPEKPMNQEKFSKEFDEYFLPKNREQKGMWGFAKIYDLAEHFAEWGYLRAAEKYNAIEYKRQLAEENDEVVINGHKVSYDKDKDAITMEEIPNDLEEAAEEFAFKSLDDVVLYGCTLSGRRACFIAGAKWQYQKDRGEFAQIKAKTWNEGFDACKEQMLKEAVEGVVTYDNFGNNVVRAGVFNKDFEYGDKVRIIVISNTDEK